MEQAIDRQTEAEGRSTLECGRCGKRVRQGRRFAFKLPSEATNRPEAGQAGEITKCLACAVRHHPMLRRSLTVAVVVGTVLTFLNQGDTIFAGEWQSQLYWKIPLTYCVPFCVATYGALSNNRR